MKADYAESITVPLTVVAVAIIPGLFCLFSFLFLAAAIMAAACADEAVHADKPTGTNVSRDASAYERLIAQSETDEVREISPEEVIQLQSHKKCFYFIDVREDSEWSEGRCKGATHIERSVLEREIEKRIPNHKALIVLYCLGGYRSGQSAKEIQKRGYSNVRSMSGGFRSWREKGFPQERQGCK